MILDADGNPMPDSGRASGARECPKCGNPALQVHRAFGGHWREVCNKCGHEVSKGRDVA